MVSRSEGGGSLWWELGEEVLGKQTGPEGKARVVRPLQGQD